MEKIRLALILVTIAIVVGPVVGIVLANQNDLLRLIVPSEIEQMMNSLGGSPQNGNQPNQTGPVNINYDPASRTATISFELQNPVPIDITLNSMSGTVECDEHRYPLGAASLKNPVQMSVGKTTNVTVLVVWTQQGLDHIQTAHQGETSTKVSLVGTNINAGGVTIEMTEPLSIGEVPLT